VDRFATEKEGQIEEGRKNGSGGTGVEESTEAERRDGEEKKYTLPVLATIFFGRPCALFM